MIREKVMVLAISKESASAYLMKFTALLGISVISPFLHFQAVTGTVVNAVLIITAVILGKREAVTIGIFPSLISIVAGFLSPVAIPLIPFIVIGNALMIFLFSFLYKESYWKGMISGSLLKFSFLYLSGVFLLDFFKGNNFDNIVSAMFSWQQLLTALSGGIVAYATLKILKKV